MNNGNNEFQQFFRLKPTRAAKVSEISEATGLSVSNVGFLLHTAIKALRQRVATQTDLMDPGVGDLS